MVKGLNAQSTEESVRQSLGKFGAISSIKVLPVAAGKTTAAAFISFTTLEEAMWIAENINGMTLPGEAGPLEIVYAPPRDPMKGGKGKGGKFDATGPYSMTGSLHKTKMCSFFQSQGFCAKGDVCGFAYGAHELNGCGKGSLGGKGGVSGMGGMGGMGGMDYRKGGMGGMGWGMGMGGGMWGGMCGGMKGSWPQPGGALKAANDGIKSKMCSFWEDRGFCAKGSACSFAHGAQELGTPVASVAPSGPSGDAGNGGLWKTKSCKFFDLGTCQKGSNCNFAHGDHELLKA